MGVQGGRVVYTMVGRVVYTGRHIYTTLHIRVSHHGRTGTSLRIIVSLSTMGERHLSAPH